MKNELEIINREVPFFARREKKGGEVYFRSKDARMVELVDTQDLKSCDHRGRVGSSPTSGTKNSKCDFFHLAVFALIV